MFEDNPNVNLDEQKEQVYDLTTINVDEPDFPLVPNGTYDAIVENVEFKFSNAGNAMLKWTFRITQNDQNNRMLFLYTVLTVDFHIKLIAKILNRILPEYDIQTFKPKTFAETGVILGKPCKIKVKVEESMNKQTKKMEKRSNVKDVLAISTGMGFMDTSEF